MKGKNHVRIFLEDIFNFAEHQEKATFGLSFLTITRNTDNSVLKKANSTIVSKTNFDAIELYLGHYTPSIPHQAILST